MFKAIESGPFRVDVVATSNGSHGPEFWAKRATEKIVSVSDTAPPAIRDQAVAFRDTVEAVVLYYIKEAVKDNASVVSNRLVEAGHPQLADMIRSV
jgi:hypothetical protein